MATFPRGNTKRTAIATGDGDLHNRANSTPGSLISGSSDMEASSPNQPRKKQRRGTNKEDHNNHDAATETTKLEAGTSDGDNEEEDIGWESAFIDGRSQEDEPEEDDHQAGPDPPIAPNTAAPAPAPASAPAHAPVPTTVALTPFQRFTALRQIYPQVPNPRTTPIGFRLFAQATEGRLRYATHSPEDDVGTGKIVAGKQIPDYALVLINDHLFQGLSYKNCKRRYLQAGGGKAGATNVADNALSKCLKLWGPRWYDDHNLAWPWRLLAAEQQRCKDLTLAGLDKRHFPQSTVQQPTPVSRYPAPVHRPQIYMSQQTAPVSQHLVTVQQEAYISQPAPLSRQAATEQQQTAPRSQLSELLGQRVPTGRLAAKRFGREVSDEEMFGEETSDGGMSDDDLARNLARSR